MGMKRFIGVSLLGRLLRAGAAAAVLALGLLAFVPAPSAQAAAWQITSYRADVTLDRPGTAQVSLTIDFDFGGTAGHGPYLVIPTRQAIADDPDHWWTMTVTLGQVTSPSGADVAVLQSMRDGDLWVRVGSEGRTFTGVQTYVIDYSVTGLIWPRQKDSGLDEFNWNAIGTAWEVPITNALVTVTGPADISRVACYHDRSYSTQCPSTNAGSMATFTSQTVPGEGMQVVAGFPPGTFTDAEPVLTPRTSSSNSSGGSSSGSGQSRQTTFADAFQLTPTTGAVTVGGGALAAWLIARGVRRHGRDQAYLGLAPGTLPAPGAAQTSVGFAAPLAPVAVAFTPPKDARPAELGTLMDATADNRDITATIVDLAVRGHLRIEQVKKSKWVFTELSNPEPVEHYESNLLYTLFQDGPQVSSKDLRDEKYANLQQGTRANLYERVTELGWFTRNPDKVRSVVTGVGFALFIVGVMSAVVLARWGFSLVAVVPVVAGVVLMALRNRFGVRTPLGSAVLAQAKGFERYLATAEADQLRWEEGQDIFSKYLPYAIAFGVARHWTKVFQELMAQGRYQPMDTGWYVGYGTGYGYSALMNSNFSSSMDSLTSSISSAMTQAATPATSGGSGFGGGGGFSGGGGGFGGGGGGGW